MAICKCYYDGDFVHSFTLSDRELKVLATETGGLKAVLLTRLKRVRVDMDFTHQGQFDHVIEWSAQAR